jgi:hypothetical protein
VDGCVWIENSSKTVLQPGDMVDVKIVQALDYDLIGEISHA